MTDASGQVVAAGRDVAGRGDTWAGRLDLAAFLPVAERSPEASCAAGLMAGAGLST